MRDYLRNLAASIKRALRRRRLGRDGETRRSIAIWYRAASSAQNDNDRAKAILHFNLWQFDNGRNFLDIGLMITQHRDVGDVYIYLPVPVPAENVSDLGNKLRDERTALGIFNESLILQVHHNSATMLRGGSLRTIFARVYCLDRGDYDLAEETTERKGTTLCVKGDAIRRAVDEVRELHSGSVVQPALAQGDRIYFRIRIRFDPHVFNPFIVHKAPVDRRVLSGHDALECVDFRLNEIRNLPRPVVDRMISHGSRLFSIEEAHFLLATALRADYVGGHKPFHKCRVLEKETWRRYAADDEARAELPDDMVIYHWKQVAVAGGASPATLHDFNVFLKFKIHKSSVAMVLTYVLLAFFIGFIGSYSANHVPLLGELFAKGQRSHQAPMNETRGR